MSMLCPIGRCICGTPELCRTACHVYTQEGGRFVDTATHEPTPAPLPRTFKPDYGIKVYTRIPFYKRAPGLRSVANVCAWLIALAAIFAFVVRAIKQI